jgi:cell division septal protein FtsQ
VGLAARLRPRRGGLTPTRAAALLALLVSGGALYGAGASDAFRFETLVLDGLRWTDATAVRELVGVEPGENLVGLRTRPIADRISSLPPVAAVRVEVRLPVTLLVRVTERAAVLVWRLEDGRRFLVDRTGLAFVQLADADSAPAGMPVILDKRAQVARELAVGIALPAVDLDAASRLASLTPADVGSAAARLAVSISDANGFVVRSGPDGWTAIFGFYTPNLRTTELIPGQVRLLKSLLFGREAEVDRVILADGENGTYIPRASTAPQPSTSP